MRLNVSDIPDEGLKLDLELPVVLNDEAAPDIAHVFIKAFRLGKKVLIEGSINISVSLHCSRCLKDISVPQELSFREEYNPSEEAASEGEKELTGGEPDLSFYSDDEIDITELIKEQVLLSVPMKPLCRPECRGICPGCGRDLNKGDCNCKAEEIDPRLAPLMEFKEKIKLRKE